MREADDGQRDKSQQNDMEMQKPRMGIEFRHEAEGHRVAQPQSCEQGEE